VRLWADFACQFIGVNALDLAVILPTYNERDNIPLVIARLGQALQGLQWEAIFVDDDSPDGTAQVIADHVRISPNIRLIHRVGRRGLASASIEGMMATQAQYVAVMDADLQHDETILPAMLHRLHGESLDIVVGTRNAVGGSMGNFCRHRVLLSRLGRRISTSVCRAEVSDPMSGFFMLRRSFLLQVVHSLQGTGFKILVDLLASSRRPVRLAEVGYTFRERSHGESKLDISVGIEYVSMIVNKLLGGILPVKLLQYILVGTLGLLTHLSVFLLLMHFSHLHFAALQSFAALAAMTENFFFNNLITFRDQQLRGIRMISGALNFLLACSFGAWADVVLSTDLARAGVSWYSAAFAGILVGSVWNLSISSQVTWRVRRSREEAFSEPVYVNALEGSR
jgi:dolichol-phosphate mannosyltransferase